MSFNNRQGRRGQGEQQYEGIPLQEPYAPDSPYDSTSALPLDGDRGPNVAAAANSSYDTPSDNRDSRRDSMEIPLHGQYPGPRDGPYDAQGYNAAHRDFERRYTGQEPPHWRNIGNSPSGSGTESPPEILQTHYQALDPKVQNELAREFTHKHQFFHLVGKVLMRWFVSLVLAGMMMLCFWQYEKIKILSHDQKRWFNALKTGLYLTLGLNLAASLKGMALLVRWKLLSRKAHDLKSVDLVLGVHSLIKVSRYCIYTSTKRPVTALCCFLWILVNMVGRLSVALTGLTYSYDSAGGTALEYGLVNTTDWSSFAPNKSLGRDETPGAEHYAAHSFGIFSTLLGEQALTEPGYYNPNRPIENPIEHAENGSYFYYMRDTNPDTTKTHGYLIAKSERRVEVRGECQYFPLVAGADGKQDWVTYLNGTQEYTLRNISEYGPAATVWINPRSDLPQNSRFSCGPRCASISAIQFLDPDTDLTPKPTTGSFYDCTVTVSPLIGLNSSNPLLDLPDSTASIAAGAIALEGFSNHPDEWEYTRYPADSPWSAYSPSVPSPNEMATRAARFSIGVIAAKDIFGPKPIQLDGTRAWVGLLLKIKWKYLCAILGSILLIQLVMGLCAVAYANQVLCKDDSYLSTARLLRPVVERLGVSGCAMTGGDIANTLNERVVYGVRRDRRKGGIRERRRNHLDLGADIRPRRHFPEGWYDGEISEGEEEKQPGEDEEVGMEVVMREGEIRIEWREEDERALRRLLKRREKAMGRTGKVKPE